MAREYYPEWKTNEHGWILKTLCWAKDRYKGTYSKRYCLYNSLYKLRIG